jgi:hypothetical protein
MLLFKVKQFLKGRTFLDRQKKAMIEWEQNGKPYPPPKLVKQSIIRSIAQQNQHAVLVETGTYKGHMVYAQFPFFKAIHSIELGKDIYEAAVSKFKNYPNVFLYNGDSGVVLKDIVPKMTEACIFWLDAHYSAGITARGILDCPIHAELETIAKSPYKHSILIDDAADFTGQDGYPTKTELETICMQFFPNHTFAEKDGIFYVLPSQI